MFIKQLLVAEKEICVLSLLQQQALLCRSNLMNLNTLPLKHVKMCNIASEDLQEVYLAAKNVLLASHCLFEIAIVAACQSHQNYALQQQC